MNATPRARLFVAVDVPSDVLEFVEAASKPLESSIEGARWTRRTGRHITIKFLGYTEADLLTELVDALASCSGHSPGPIRVSGLGAFPSAKRARVVWAGIDDPAALLPRLAADLDRALQTVGFEPEARAFSPHLTLARLREPCSVERDLASVHDLESRAFEVGSFCLYRSHLHPKGATYERLREFPLARPSDIQASC